MAPPQSSATATKLVTSATPPASSGCWPTLAKPLFPFSSPFPAPFQPPRPNLKPLAATSPPLKSAASSIATPKPSPSAKKWTSCKSPWATRAVTPSWPPPSNAADPSAATSTAANSSPLALPAVSPIRTRRSTAKSATIFSKQASGFSSAAALQPHRGIPSRTRLKRSPNSALTPSASACAPTTATPMIFFSSAWIGSHAKPSLPA